MQLAGARDAPGQEGGSQGWIAARRAGEFSGDRESESFICVLDSATPGSYKVRGSKQLDLHVSVCEAVGLTLPPLLGCAGHLGPGRLPGHAAVPAGVFL